MDGKGLNIDFESFNRLFPFYFQMSADLKIISFGHSLLKVCPDLKIGAVMNDFFEINRPHLDCLSFEEIMKNKEQHVLVECIQNQLLLRGQFEFIDNTLLFVGSPW